MDACRNYSKIINRISAHPWEPSGPEKWDNRRSACLDSNNSPNAESYVVRVGNNKIIIGTIRRNVYDHIYLRSRSNSTDNQACLLKLQSKIELSFRRLGRNTIIRQLHPNKGTTWMKRRIGTHGSRNIVNEHCVRHMHWCQAKFYIVKHVLAVENKVAIRCLLNSVFVRKQMVHRCHVEIRIKFMFVVRRKLDWFFGQRNRRA